jgi:hypothetical protein
MILPDFCALAGHSVLPESARAGILRAMLFSDHATPGALAAAAVALLLAAGSARAAEGQAAPVAGDPKSPTPAAAPPARAPSPRGPLLRGPHPFGSQNVLTGGAGYAVANQFHGLRAGVGYGYELAGSLWFDLHLDVIDADTGNAAERIYPACTTCGKVETFASVLGGLSYRLRANVPVIPYATITAGPIYLFNRNARGAIGMAARSAVGARYYLYDWLGFGLELAGLLGSAALDEAAGMSSTVALFDLGISAEFQF